MCFGYVTVFIMPFFIADGESLVTPESVESAAEVALKEENERLREKTLCPLCCDREKEVVPNCGHGLCRTCAFDPRTNGPRSLSCPYCTKRYTGLWLNLKN